MEWRTRRSAFVVGALGLGLLVSGRAAHAQLGGAPFPTTGGVASASSTGTTGLNANPFMNPYMNPFMNPYMTQSQMPPGNAALYFIAAQQMNGGIGSGRLSGVRPGPAAPGMAPGSIGKKAEEARQGGANVPGAGAARYFNRTYPTTLSTISQYHRPAKQFPSTAPGR
jgi:hypothetical protein